MPLRDLADLERRIRRLEMGVDQSRHKLVVPERTVSVAPPLGAGDVPYVDLSTDQNVAGVKTFVAFPVTPSSAPTTDYQVANKKYVDDNIGGGVTDHGALTGLEDDDHPQYQLKSELGVWQSYAIQWTAATTNPSFGNADVSAIYTTFGTLCVLVVGVVMGSTTTYGSGDWRFSLPLPAKNRAGINFFGVAHLRKVGSSNHERVAQIAPAVSPTDIRLFTQMDDNTNNLALNATAPFAWANGSAIGFQIMYEWDPEA